MPRSLPKGAKGTGSPSQVKLLTCSALSNCSPA